MRYFIDIAYNGKNYHGWQIQPDALSVQEVLEFSLSTVLRSELKVTGAGRTDTGVHARQLFAHFDFVKIEDPEHLVYKLNSLLPSDISAKKISEVPIEAHARFDAIEREYEYRISLKKNPFVLDFAYTLRHVPDVALMNEAANVLLQYNDFQCFSRNKTNVKTYNCVIKSAHWIRQGDELIFTISADRFLRNMVRAIVGTLLEVGDGKVTIDQFHEIIKSKDRGKAGTSAPAHGLYLTKVVYPKEIGVN